MPPKIAITRSAVLALLACSTFACGNKAPPPGGITPKQLTDTVHAVLEADRATYTKQVVNRLQNEEAVIKASEHWKDDKALPLPAQMFRMGAELAAKKVPGLNYALLSPWPVNKQNTPTTQAEKAGLDFVVQHKDQNYYGEEELGGSKYFTAVYPDVAISEACVQCHNGHKDSPRRDFKLGDVMGGVVIRVPSEGS